MKVRELITKAHLEKGQKVVLRDNSTMQTLVSQDRCCFGLDSDEVERLFNLAVDHFTVSAAGLRADCY